MPIAAYTLLTDEQWASKIEAAFANAVTCSLCPRCCKVNRLEGEKGFCRAPGHLVVSSMFAHHGEEPPLSGSAGSGTIFFSSCTLRCEFCQNFQISSEGEGTAMTPEALAQGMIALQEQGCHNINLVTADHFLPWILEALRHAVNRGLTIPIVYNCSGYESLESLAILDEVIDIYLPDMKYGNNAQAAEYSHVLNYVPINQEAIRAMFRQVGPLLSDKKGIAYRGLCIRHLVLPEDQSASSHIADFLSQTFDPADITISLMAQYRPLHRAHLHPPIAKKLLSAEYDAIKDYFLSKGFNGFFQEVERLDTSFVIDFTTRKTQRLEGSGH